ncbi:hypothetical protein GQ54DRAFT_58054 [Martensiomyces pterosporus]|nr:hypothetical protein GQ54DRAFT_58054 [Martensiomyces pterosporus]
MKQSRARTAMPGHLEIYTQLAERGLQRRKFLLGAIWAATVQWAVPAVTMLWGGQDDCLPLSELGTAPWADTAVLFCAVLFCAINGGRRGYFTRRLTCLKQSHCQRLCWASVGGKALRLAGRSGGWAVGISVRCAPPYWIAEPMLISAAQHCFCGRDSVAAKAAWRDQMAQRMWLGARAALQSARSLAPQRNARLAVSSTGPALLQQTACASTALYLEAVSQYDAFCVWPGTVLAMRAFRPGCQHAGCSNAEGALVFFVACTLNGAKGGVKEREQAV